MMYPHPRDNTTPHRAMKPLVFAIKLAYVMGMFKR
jgi:hypothetical protein